MNDADNATKKTGQMSAKKSVTLFQFICHLINSIEKMVEFKFFPKYIYFFSKSLCVPQLKISFSSYLLVTQASPWPPSNCASSRS